MKKIVHTTLLAAVIGVACVSAASAQSVSTAYDMSRLLNEPHPLAAQMGVRWQPLAPVAAPGRTAAPAPRPATPVSATRRAAPPPKAPARAENDNLGDDRWFSEVRVGALKHAVSLIGNTTKETGMDANLEVLFGSPGWLKWAWAPRPYIGTSLNGSSTNTDIVYTGLTWEWKPWKGLFFDFSFGFAVHNGELEYDSSVAFPADAGRHREFGCRWLFRESLEGGWIFAERHAVSIMWSHYSHGGICADQNEGLDNLGVRYGYRF